MYRAPLSFEHRIHPTHRVAVIVGVLAENGIPAAEALLGSGIAESQLLAPATRISYRQMLTVFRNALRLAPDPAFALRAGQRMHITAFGMYGYALLSSSTHAAAIDLAVRYSRVTGPVADLEFFQEDNVAIWAYKPILSEDPTEDLYRFAMEFHIASQKTLYTDLYGPSFSFSGARVAYAAPAHARLYESILKCPVLFNQPRNELRFDAIRMKDPMLYANPVTNTMVCDLCEQSLAEVARSGGVASDIHRILVEHPGRFPEIDAMAVELGMNERMLRRKLDAENTSYRQILAEVRQRLAIEYLRKTRMTNEEIATQLGYSDAANFRHAFMRWTNKHPSDFRVKSDLAVSMRSGRPCESSAAATSAPFHQGPAVASHPATAPGTCCRPRIRSTSSENEPRIESIEPSAANAANQTVSPPTARVGIAPFPQRARLG